MDQVAQLDKIQPSWSSAQAVKQKAQLRIVPFSPNTRLSTTAAVADWLVGAAQNIVDEVVVQLPA